MKTTNIGEHFDKKASAWDASERRVALAAAITAAMERELAEKPSCRLLDYGAGTGLCSLALAPRCTSVLAMDVSSGMLAKLNEKAIASGIANLETLQHDLSVSPFGESRFDAILCAMTLHHIRDVQLLLTRFRELLAPNGVLAIADLDKEDGTFHDDPTGVEHNGFVRSDITRRLVDAGFSFTEIQTAHRIQKPPGNKCRVYPVFFATGRMAIPSLTR